MQKEKQRKQRHSFKLGKKRRESSKRNYYIISPRVIIKAIIIIIGSLTLTQIFLILFLPPALTFFVSFQFVVGVFCWEPLWPIKLDTAGGFESSNQGTHSRADLLLGHVNFLQSRLCNFQRTSRPSWIAKSIAYTDIRQRPDTGLRPVFRGGNVTMDALCFPWRWGENPT